MICKLRSLRWLLLGVAMLAAAANGAEMNCPWLNSATASGILGGPVVVTVIDTNKNSDDATCTFSYRERGIARGLHIVVTTTSSPGQQFAAIRQQCGLNPTPLKAIGNEAVECTLEDKAERSAQVVGRVRDRAFVVKVSTSRPNDPELTQRAQAEKAKDVAEQVAGSLY